MPEETKITRTTETRTMHVQQEQGPSMFSNIIAVIGFIILIVILIWGLVHIATLSQPWFASLFNNKSTPTIQVMAPANATSSTPFAVTWKYSPSEKGSYAFIYQCKSGFHFEVPAANGGTNSLPCGAAVTAPTTNTLFLTPILSGAGPVSVPLSIVFIPSATSSKQVQGSATVVVHEGPTLAQPTITKTVATTPPKTVSKPRVTGPADLSVRIVSVNVDASGNGVATFDIANVGGSSTGNYYFSAQLPTQSGYAYTSPLQSPLGPGDHIVNTLNFSQGVGGLFSVTVDPSGSVSEINKTNNYASQSISMPYYNNYQYSPQPYPQYQYTY